MNVLQTILVVLEAIASIALIVVVLLQSGKEAGLSGAIAGNTDTYMGKNKGNTLDKLASKATKWIALAWGVLTLVLNLI